MRPCFMGPLKGNVTGVGLQVHARTFLRLSCPSCSMFNNDASCRGWGGVGSALLMLLPFHVAVEASAWATHSSTGGARQCQGKCRHPSSVGHIFRSSSVGWCNVFVWSFWQRWPSRVIYWVPGVQDGWCSASVGLWHCPCENALVWGEKNIYTMLQINALIDT